jgi:hypothetical protein
MPKKIFFDIEIAPPTEIAVNYNSHEMFYSKQNDIVYIYNHDYSQESMVLSLPVLEIDLSSKLLKKGSNNNWKHMTITFDGYTVGDELPETFLKRIINRINLQNL